MINDASGNAFTRLVYRAAAEKGAVEKTLLSRSGPSKMCSFTALLDQDGMTIERRQHLRECPFCARLSIRLRSGA